MHTDFNIAALPRKHPTAARQGLLRLFVGILVSSFLIWSGLAGAQGLPHSLPTDTRSNPPAGTIDVITGRVRIITGGQPDRYASVGDKLRETDFVVTGNASEALITLADQGFIAVRANSRVQILSYKADGGEDDNGIFRLVEGGMRSVTGWIGKFNRTSYRIQTPAATIGIRGTDHETRVVAPGDGQGAPGTYDKVFIGKTTIETDAGETEITPDTAGFVSSDAERPRVLASVPPFFKPGPNEDLINAKHAEIQSIIEQRRADRQRVVEQLRKETDAAAADLKVQSDSNRQAADARNLAGAEQLAGSEQKRAALRAQQELVDQQRKQIPDLRSQIVYLASPFTSRNPDVSPKLKALRETATELQADFKQLATDRRNLNEKNVAAVDARKAAAQQHRKAADQKLADLQALVPGLQQRNKDIQQMRLEVNAGYTKTPEGNDTLSAQRAALNAAAKSADAERHHYQEQMNALFQDNMAFSDANIKAAEDQTLATDRQIAAFNAREEDLLKRQQENDQARERLQLDAITVPDARSRVQSLMDQVHLIQQAVLQQRSAMRDEFSSVHRDEFTATQQRQEASVNEIRIIKEKHAEFTGKLADLEAESAAMQQEIRSLYDQEQSRYQQELKAARSERLSTPELPTMPADPDQ